MRRAPVILVFDTSTSTAVVAVGRGSRVLAVRHEPAPRTYDAGLLPHIVGALAEAELRASDIGVIACGRGPGSFTGLRIALATAKGYAFALDRPLVLVSSTAATAAAVPGAAPVVVVLDAKRGQLFAQLFRRDAARAGPARPAAAELLDAGELEGWIRGHVPVGPVVLAGEAAPAAGVMRDAQLRVLPIRFPPGRPLLALAARAWREGDVTPPDGAEPEYLRPPPFNKPALTHRGAKGSRG